LRRDLPGLQRFRAELLGKAVDYYRDFLRDHADSPDLKVESAHAYHRLGQALDEVGSKPEALDAYNKALGLYQERTAGGAGAAADRLALASVYLDVGNNVRANSTSGAERHYVKALETLRPISDGPGSGDARLALAKGLTNLGNLYHVTGRPAKAEPY